MSARPLVTVMIPTYAQAGFVEQAVESALAQTWPNLEVIVCDDASPDDTVARLARFTDARLRVVRNECNLGRVGNYRRLLHELAGGDYVVNLDGDDYFRDPGFITEAMSFIARDPECVLVAGHAATDEGGKDFGVTGSVRCLSGLRLLAELPAAQQLMHMGVVYDRKRALALDFYRSPAISSDWESLYRLATQGSVVLLDRCVGVWRQHGGNTTATAKLTQQLDNLRIWAAIADAARAAGMAVWRVAWLRLCCEAHGLSAVCVACSREGALAVPELLCRAWATFGVRMLAWVLYLPATLRVVASLLGYYRWRHPAGEGRA
ncbi:glycosyltransferase [Uliginosibacterium sp. 31-16]|uniref:glycosyltransferase family 2 protein n=1 Tax=Uliginosibacterium sp. 31-16 TaxID=3068315 RepID=UPI00273E071A|nr:glycosyltransferase [Uliginosibacterium sp. 31-16]MDP5238382.1 glycosyltransferase [Uliginosibacterium sp. 31-16]